MFGFNPTIARIVSQSQPAPAPVVVPQLIEEPEYSVDPEVQIDPTYLNPVPAAAAMANPPPMDPVYIEPQVVENHTVVNDEPERAAGLLSGIVGGAGASTVIDAVNKNNNAPSTSGSTSSDLRDYLQLSPQLFNQYAQYAPQYANVDLNTFKQTLFGNDFNGGQFFFDNPDAWAGYQADNQGLSAADYAKLWLSHTQQDPGRIYNYYSGGAIDLNQRLTDIANKQTVDSNTALRQGNVKDAANMGGQALSTLKTLNPNLYSALDMTQAAAGAGVTASPYEAALGKTFNAGPSFQSVSGYTINPNAVSATNNPLLSTANLRAQNLGNTGLGDDLSSMARQQLALGGKLSDEQKRNATQAAREAFAARGLLNTNGAVAQEILNRDAYSQNLLQQRQAFAQGVNQLEQAQGAQNNSYMLGALGANATQGDQNLKAALSNQENAYNSQLATGQFGQQAQMSNQAAGLQAQQNNTGLGTALASLDYSRQNQAFGNLVTNAQLQSANQFNPFATITSAGSANQGTNPALFGTGATVSSGGASNQNVLAQYNPLEMYGFNKNAEATAKAAAANSKAATTGAIIGGVSTLGAAGLIAL